MKYPNEIKVSFTEPKRKISEKKFRQFRDVLNNFGAVLITRSRRWDSGVKYSCAELGQYNDGEVEINFVREDKEKD